MKSFILIFFIIGIIMVITGYNEHYKNCPEPLIEYRYIPRSFYDEQVSDVNLKNLYSDMFNKPSTWSKYPLGNNDNNIKPKLNNFSQSG